MNDYDIEIDGKAVMDALIRHRIKNGENKSEKEKNFRMKLFESFRNN